eukprot:gene12380-3038_t
MSKRDVYASNNRAIIISASTTTFIVVLMTIGFLILLRRRKQERRNPSNDSPNAARRETDEAHEFSESPKRMVTISRGLKPHEEVENEQVQVIDENVSSSATILSGSLSSSGQYHFSFRELEFADKVLDSTVEDNVPEETSIQQDLRKIAEESSDEDTTYETTVGSQ